MAAIDSTARELSSAPRPTWAWTRDRWCVPLAVAGGCVAIAGLLAEVAEYEWGVGAAWVELFSLSYEANLPTWYSTVLLFACGTELWRIGDALPKTARHRRHWTGLGAIFLYLSLDEAIQLHEHLGILVDGRGVLYFSWVVPAALALALLGLTYFSFLRALDPRTRRRFVIAGALYVGGALAMELPLGAWTEQHGDDNLGYGVLDWIEETLEIAGASLFLLALRAERPPA